MNDAEFLQAFESGTLGDFPHRSHLRMAWLYLRRDGWERGFVHIREGVQHFAASKGASAKYHETITRFWAYLVNWVILELPDEDDFDRFISAHPGLLDTGLIKHHFSLAALHSDLARHKWLEPDLKPLPTQKQPE